MPIYSPTGFLDITNATLRTSNTECQNLKIGTGNLYVTSEISPDYVLNLSNVTNLGATSPHTLTLSNVTTAIDATSNIITSGNLKIGGLIYTKDWGFRTANAGNYLYVGRFTELGITEVLITDQSSSLSSTSKYTITRNFDSAPLVNGIDSSSTVNYEWYYHSVSGGTYDLWVSPNATVQTIIKVTSSTYTEVAEPTSVTRVPCANGLITMSGNVVANQNLTVSGNTFYTSPVSINVDSNVVAEYTGPHDRPLRKYPEVALTSASQGGYVVTPSTQNGVNVAAYNMFDGSARSGRWRPNATNDTYDTSSPFLYNGSRSSSISDTSGTTHDGVFLKLELPKAIKLDHTIIRENSDPASGTPGKITFLGSTNGTDWTFLKEFSGMSSTALDETYRINDTNYYNHFAFVVKNLSDTSGELTLGEWELYGHEEGDASLDTTLKSIYNVPATTGTQLEVYYDGQDYTDVTSTVNDKVGTATNATITNTDSAITFDSTYKAWTFGGTDTRISNIQSSALPSNFSGDQVHSVALWFKCDTVSGDTLFSITQPSDPWEDDEKVISVRFSDESGGFRYLFWSNDIRYDGTEASISKDIWYHLCVTYSGGGGTTDNKKLYLNGNEIHHTSTSGTYFGNNLSLPSGSVIRLGSRVQDTTRFFGSIANFRLYSKALNADQVKELYDYQKDYFFGSKSQLTLYKGHLGVGVTEPSGQLELAGDERLQEYPPRALTGYETLVEGHGVFCAYASTEQNANRLAWMAFNDESGETTSGSSGFWRSEYLNSTDGPYNASTGAYIANARLGSDTALGEYVVLQLPYKIQLRSVRMSPWYRTVSDDYDLAEFPKNFTIYGSNDGNNWYSVFVSPSQTLTASSGSGATTETTSYSITSNEYYKYFGLVVTETNYGNYSTIGYATSIGDLQYFGTPGPTTLDKGSLSLTRSLDVPRVSRYDVDTETPRPEKLVVDFDTTVNDLPTDISGKGNHGTSGTYSAVDKAFTFDGSSDYIDVNLPSELDGDPTLTISMWVNPITLATANGQYDTFVHLGENTSHSKQLQITYYGYDGHLVIGGWNQTMKTNDASAAPVGVWTHICAVIKPGAWGTDTKKLYINGEFFPTTLSGSGTTAIPSAASNSRLVFGAVINNTGTGYVHHSNIKMSKPQIWSVALEPSEIRKLYNLGRTGRSMVISDTAVGIGKAPEANLDVRGSLAVRGGNVMIGQADIQVRLATDPGYSTKIDGGSMFITNPSTSGGYEHFIMNNSTTGTHKTTYFSFRRGNGQIGSILTDTGAFINFNTGSDYRLKENIVPMSNVGLEVINKLQPKVFNFKNYPNQRVHGFIAHELQEHIPIAVSGEKDEMRGEEPMYQGVDASKIVPWLVKAIQELYEENQTLKTRLDALETSNVETQ